MAASSTFDLVKECGKLALKFSELKWQHYCGGNEITVGDRKRISGYITSTALKDKKKAVEEIGEILNSGSERLALDTDWKDEKVANPMRDLLTELREIHTKLKNIVYELGKGQKKK